MQRYYVGVDSAKATFSVATSWQQTVAFVGEWSNTQTSCTEFCVQMEAQAQACGAEQIHLLIEPTGGYETQLVALAYQRGWLVTQVNPLLVRNWARGMGKRAKTDRQDALLLAAYGQTVQPAPQKPVAASVTELDSLLRRQADLEKLLRSERNRQAQAEQNLSTSSTVRQSLARTIEALEEELALIQQAIGELTKCDLGLAQQLKQLRSIPGVGLKLAPRLLVALSRFWARTAGQGTAKQMVSFAGLDPAPYEGGTLRKRATISKRGDRSLRSALYLGALGGTRGRNHLRHVYDSLLANGKAKKLALIACARKILTWAWVIFTRRTTFDPAHFHP